MNPKKLKKAQIVLVYSLFGCIIGISFILLLLSNHLYNVRMNSTLKGLNKHSQYSFIMEEKKHCNNQKYKLFSIEDYDFSGYCIKEIYLSYNNLTFPLKDILKKKYLQIEDILKNTTKIWESEHIEKYKNDKEEYIITVNKPVKNYKEVIFSKES